MPIRPPRLEIRSAISPLVARESRSLLTIVYAVTSLVGMPLDVAVGAIDAAYSLHQNARGPSGLAPVVFGSARAAFSALSSAASTSISRSSRTTGCGRSTTHYVATLVYAFLATRCRLWRRKGSTRAGRGTSGTIACCSNRWRPRPVRLPRDGARPVDAQCREVPDGVDEGGGACASARYFNIESARSWSARRQDLARRPEGRELVAAADRTAAGALESALAKQRQRSDWPTPGPAQSRRRRPGPRSLRCRHRLRAAWPNLYLTLTLPDVPRAETSNPTRPRSWSCAMRRRAPGGRTPRRVRRGNELPASISPDLKRAGAGWLILTVLQHEVDLDQLQQSNRGGLGRSAGSRAWAARSRSSWRKNLYLSPSKNPVGASCAS